MKIGKFLLAFMLMWLVSSVALCLLNQCYNAELNDVVKILRRTCPPSLIVVIVLFFLQRRK